MSAVIYIIIFIVIVFQIILFKKNLKKIRQYERSMEEIENLKVKKNPLFETSESEPVVSERSNSNSISKEAVQVVDVLEDQDNDNVYDWP